MRIFAFLLLTLSLSAQDKPKPDWIYRSSVAAMIGAQTADIASSWNRAEANPIYGQRFTARDVALKSGIAAGTLTVQALILRKWPQAKRAASIINFACSGVVVYVAARNAGR